MTQFKLLVILVFAVVHAGVATADDKPQMAIAGSYFLTQDDKFQRVITFEPGGGIFQVSDQQTLLGFSGGQGTWKQTGADTVSARVIDFSFDRKTGERIGPTVIKYDFKFSDKTFGKFQSVTGSFSGATYPVGDNPLRPAKKPFAKFSIGFKGERIGLE